MNTSRLFTAGIALTVFAATALPAAGKGATLRKAEFPPLPCTQSPNYAQATADAPQYDDKVIWPNLSKKEFYFQQQWPAGRLLVWAGKATGSKPAAGTDPANWLENGKPATVPPDENTDVRFPDADKTYMVELGSTWLCRHMTVGKNATVRGANTRVAGNIWVKEGGRLQTGFSIRLLGASRHTFLRADLPSFRDQMKAIPSVIGGQAGDTGFEVTAYFIFDRPTGSVEILGSLLSIDEIQVIRGTVIIGPDSEFCIGVRAATPPVNSAGTLVLMDGARICRSMIQPSFTTLAVYGKLLGGLPERPLTRDCFVGIDTYDPDRTTRSLDTPGLVVNGTIAVHRAPGSLASLVVDCPDYKKIASSRGVSVAPDALPAYVEKLGYQGAVWVGKKATVSGVRFDGVRRGCLFVEDESVRGQMQNISFGDKNGAKPDELFAVQAKTSVSTQNIKPQKYNPADAELLP